MLNPLNHFFFMLFLKTIFFTNLVKHIGCPLLFLGLHNYELKHFMFMNFTIYKKPPNYTNAKGRKS